MEKSSFSAMRVSHLGKILSNFAILGAVICLASVAYFLLIAIYYVLLIAVLLGTLFLILIYSPEFMELFSSTETLNAFVADFSSKYIPIIAPVTIAVAALAIAALALSKQKNTSRIVVAVICLVIATVYTVIYSFMGGGSK